MTDAHCSWRVLTINKSRVSEKSTRSGLRLLFMQDLFPILRSNNYTSSIIIIIIRNSSHLRSPSSPSKLLWFYFFCAVAFKFHVCSLKMGILKCVILWSFSIIDVKKTSQVWIFYIWVNAKIIILEKIISEDYQGMTQIPIVFSYYVEQIYLHLKMVKVCHVCA